MTVTSQRTVAVLGSTDPVSAAIGWAVDATVADITAQLDTELDGVVIVVGADPGPEPIEMSGLEEPTWRRLTDEPMHDTLVALQRARSAVSDRGGRIVVVLATVGLSGSPQLVPYTTALEGIRAMVKSAARQWSSSGVRVNMVAVPLHLLHPDANAGFGDHLTVAAVPDDGTMVESVVEAVLFLLHSEAKHLTGVTLIADGGSVMLP